MTLVTGGVADILESDGKQQTPPVLLEVPDSHALSDSSCAAGTAQREDEAAASQLLSGSFTASEARKGK